MGGMVHTGVQVTEFRESADNAEYPVTIIGSTSVSTFNNYDKLCQISSKVRKIAWFNPNKYWNRKGNHTAVTHNPSEPWTIVDYEKIDFISSKKGLISFCKNLFILKF